MIAKNKLFLCLSIVVFFVLLVSIVTSGELQGNLDDSLPIFWIVLLILVFLLPILNLAEIILNKDSWNKLYWIGLIFNLLSIFFVMRYFAIELDFVKMFKN